MYNVGKPTCNDYANRLIGNYRASRNFLKIWKFDILMSIACITFSNFQIGVWFHWRQTIPILENIALEFEGKRFDCGSKEGYISAIIDRASSIDKYKSIIEK